MKFSPVLAQVIVPFLSRNGQNLQLGLLQPFFGSNSCVLAAAGCTVLLTVVGLVRKPRIVGCKSCLVGRVKGRLSSGGCTVGLRLFLVSGFTFALTKMSCRFFGTSIPQHWSGFV